MRELRSSVQEIREKQMKKQILAADYGASGGRVMLGEYDGSRIRTSQVHRFVNEPVWLGGTMFWDFLRLFHELKTGIKKSPGLREGGQHRRGYLGRGFRAHR